MAGERQLTGRGEDPDPQVAVVLGWQEEDGLGEVELARGALHLPGGQAPAVGEHRELVALQRGVGEHVRHDVPARGGTVTARSRPQAG